MASSVSLREVIALGSPKEAALYFERVFPFDLTDTRFKNLGLKDGAIDPNAIPFKGEVADKAVVDSLLGPKHAVSYEHYAALGGAAIPMGRAALEVVRIRMDAMKDKFDRPLRYLSRLEKLSR